MPRLRRPQKTFPINVRALTVADVEDLTPGMRRITLTGDQLGAFTTADGIEVPPLRNEGFDDHVKIIVPGLGEEDARPPRQVEGQVDWRDTSPAKDYTPRYWDPEAGRLVLDFVRHSTGFASAWAEGVRVGDAAYIAGPKNSLLMPEDVDWLLAAGDETALPAIARLLDEWPDGLRGQVFIEVAEPAHRIEVAEPALVDVTWLFRDGAPAGHSTLLVDAVRDAPWWPGQPYCWLAGEAMTLKPLRSYLKIEREVPRDCLDVTGYWRRTEATSDASGRPVTVRDESGEQKAAVRRMLDLTAPVALRAAIATGVITRLERAPATPGELAADLDLHEPTVRGLLRYLGANDVLALDPADPAVTSAGTVRLGVLGEALVSEFDGYADPGNRFWDLTPDRLVTTLREGTAVAREDGRSAQAVLAAASVEGQAVRDHLTAQAGWAAPSIHQHHDWSGYGHAAVFGSGAAALISVLRDHHSDLEISQGGAPRTDGVSVATQWLEHLTDSAAVLALRDLTDSAAAVGAPFLLAERVTEVGEPVHDHDAEADLALRVAFGSGLRTSEQIGALLVQAGLESEPPLALGWDMQLWVVRA